MDSSGHDELINQFFGAEATKQTSNDEDEDDEYPELRMRNMETAIDLPMPGRGDVNF